MLRRCGVEASDALEAAACSVSRVKDSSREGLVTSRSVMLTEQAAASKASEA